LSLDPNPWIHRRLDVYFGHPSLARPLRVPGYFTGDGSGSLGGRVWRAHFTPTLEGDWIWFAIFEGGEMLNAAPGDTVGLPLPLLNSAGTFAVGPRDNAAPGFQSKGALLHVEGERYFCFGGEPNDPFVLAGVGSPENLLGYAGFTRVEDGSSANGVNCCCKQACFDDCRRTICGNAGDPAAGFLHRYAPHEIDWNAGDPDWEANGLPNQGRGIIGALNYLGDTAEVNSLYFMTMNLGGDGKDTYPFLTNGGGADCPSEGSGFSPAHTLNYDVARMDQWRTVFEHANDKGIMLQVILAEQEACNIRWFGEHDSDGGPRNHMSVYRRLFMKQMVAEFGHVLGLRWNLCEENQSAASCTSGTSSCGQSATLNAPQFSPEELDEMARWISEWDVMGHAIGVHTAPNDLGIYAELLALPEPPAWLTMVSLQLHGEWGTGQQYEDVMRSTAHLFAQAGRDLPIINDEQGSPARGLSSEFNTVALSTSTADDRRRRVLYDVLLSRGQISYYFGYYTVSNGGGDLRCEDFRTRDSALRQMSFARKVAELIKIWDASDRDDLLIGSVAASQFGRPEVAASQNGQRIAVYYPALRDLPTSAVKTGSLDLTEFAKHAYQALWFDPVEFREVGERVDVFGGEITPVPIPDIDGDGVPGNAITPETDLILLLLSSGPSPSAAQGQ
jgi:hypothetical protein